MEIFFKFLFILILAVLILGAGFYITLTNVSHLMSTDNPHWQFKWLASGLLIRTGNWREVVDLRPPLKITRQANEWIFRSPNLTILVNTKPKLRIQWKKSLAGRTSTMNDEY